MASSKVYVSIDSLKEIANSLDKQRVAIEDCVKSQILPAIKNSADCFQVSGLNSNQIVSSFNSTFNNLDNNLSKLVSVLNNDVIKNYTDVTISVKQMFNQEFASKMSELLNLK